MGDLGEDIGDLDGGSGGAHADEVAGGVGAHEHIHADAVLTGLEAVELAHQDGSDGEDHDDLDGDGEAADERTQGTVDEIADDKFVHAVNSVWERTAFGFRGNFVSCSRLFSSRLSGCFAGFKMRRWDQKMVGVD